MKKFFVVFSVLAILFISCDSNNDEENSIKWNAVESEQFKEANAERWDEICFKPDEDLTGEWDVIGVEYTNYSYLGEVYETLGNISGTAKISNSEMVTTKTEEIISSESMNEVAKFFTAISGKRYSASQAWETMKSTSTNLTGMTYSYGFPYKITQNSSSTVSKVFTPTYDSSYKIYKGSRGSYKIISTYQNSTNGILTASKTTTIYKKKSNANIKP